MSTKSSLAVCSSHNFHKAQKVLHSSSASAMSSSCKCGGSCSFSKVARYSALGTCNDVGSLIEMTRMAAATTARQKNGKKALKGKKRPFSKLQAVTDPPNNGDKARNKATRDWPTPLTRAMCDGRAELFTIWIIAVKAN